MPRTIRDHDGNPLPRSIKDFECSKCLGEAAIIDKRILVIHHDWCEIYNYIRTNHPRLHTRVATSS